MCGGLGNRAYITVLKFNIVLARNVNMYCTHKTRNLIGFPNEKKKLTLIMRTDNDLKRRRIKKTKFFMNFLWRRIMINLLWNSRIPVVRDSYFIRKIFGNLIVICFGKIQ